MFLLSIPVRSKLILNSAWSRFGSLYDDRDVLLEVLMSNLIDTLLYPFEMPN